MANDDIKTVSCPHPVILQKDTTNMYYCFVCKEEFTDGQYHGPLLYRDTAVIGESRGLQS